MKDVIIEEDSDVKMINHGFSHINEVFNKYNWILIKNTYSEIIYKRDFAMIDEFIIKIKNKHIEVYIPFKTNIIYKTIFKNYYDASEFLELHIKVYDDLI